MRNLKVVFVSAAAGFFLSLFFGLFSHAGFLRILLRAVIVAVAFGGLAFFISFLYQKILSVEPSEDEGSDSVSEGRPQTGTAVNLVISDSELEQSGNSNHYTVGNRRQMLNDSDISHIAMSVERKMDMPRMKAVKKDGDFNNEGFVPVHNAETISNFSGTESVNPQKLQEAAKNEAATAAPSDVDVLPDMMGISFNSDISTPVVSERNDSENSYGGSDNSYVSNDTAGVEVKDASLIAKAISSVLAEET